MRSKFLHLQQIALSNPVFSLKIQTTATCRNHHFTLLFTEVCCLLLPWETLAFQADIREAITSNSFCCSPSLCVNSAFTSICSWHGTKDKQPLTCVEPLLPKQHSKGQWPGQVPRTQLFRQVSWMALCPLSTFICVHLEGQVSYGVGKRTPYSEPSNETSAYPSNITSWSRVPHLVWPSFILIHTIFSHLETLR